MIGFVICRVIVTSKLGKVLIAIRDAENRTRFLGYRVEAYKLFVGETDTNPASAGVLGVLLVCSTTIAVVIQRRYLGRRRFATGARRAPPLIDVGPGWRALAKSSRRKERPVPATWKPSARSSVSSLPAAAATKTRT